MCTNATTQTNDSFACLLSEFTDSFLYMIFTSCSSVSCAHKCLHSLTLLLRAHPCAYTVDVSYRVTSSSILLRATISGVTRLTFLTEWRSFLTFLCAYNATIRLTLLIFFSFLRAMQWRLTLLIFFVRAMQHADWRFLCQLVRSGHLLSFNLSSSSEYIFSYFWNR